MMKNILIFLAVVFIGQIVAQFQQGGRSPQLPGQQGGRGGWSVDVNKNKGRGPQIRTQAEGNIYTSPKGNWQVNGNGFHEFGKGRKPDYGVGISASGRFRRDLSAEDQEQQQQLYDFIPDDDAEILRNKRSPNDRGRVTVDVTHEKGRGPQIHTEAQGRIYTSPRKNFEINGYGSHDAGRGRKPDFGVGVRATGRFRRDISDLEEFENVEELNDDDGNLERDTRSLKGGQSGDRGSWDVSVNKDKGRGPQVRTEAKGNIYKGDKVRVDAQGHHEFGRGRKPDYGGKVGVSGRWRRSVVDEEMEDALNIPDEFYNDDLLREKRSPQGSLNIAATPQGVRTDIQRNVYTSPSRNFGVDANAFHQMGKGQRPTYGGGVTAWGQSNKWSGSMNVNKERGFGPQVHSEVQRNLYKHGNFGLNAGAFHDFGAGRRPTYGGVIKGGYNF